MGEIANQIVNGEICEMCLMPFPAEGGLGYPAKCIECGGTELRRHNHSLENVQRGRDMSTTGDVLRGGEIELLLGDSKTILPTLPSDSIDLILTDPPYNLTKYSTGKMKFAWRSDLEGRIADWDKREFRPVEWVNEFARVLSPNGNMFIFTSYNMLGPWHDVLDSIFNTFQFMVWHKTNPTPNIRKAGFLNSCELIVCVWNKGHTWNFISQKEMHNFIETPICMGNERLKDPKHPTQKPVRVLKHIIERASNPGDIVLDPFMGVGSVGVATYETKRKFIGIEIDEQYYKAAVKRIKGPRP